MSVNATWYGNAAFHLRDDTGTDIYLDPWLEGNPGCPIRVEDVASAGWVIVSHGDPGHYRDSVAIARRTGATYVAHHNLCDYIASAGLLPFTQLAGLSLGKSIGQGGFL